MAEVTQEPSMLSQVLSIYRDVELAKRAQPKLVQGAQQVQVPFQQNVTAPQQPQNISSNTGTGGIINASMVPKYLLWGGLGLLGVALILKLKR